jgi:hypothetical protein
VRDDEELGRFERRFVFYNTVLRNPGTVQGSAECAQTAHERFGSLNRVNLIEMARGKVSETSRNKFRFGG